MYFVYVLLSKVYKTRYIGSTSNIENRLKEHNSGKVRYTKGRMPWDLIYSETFTSRGEAMKREKYLKTGQGRMFLDTLITI
jgi:putative endonuclease